MLGRVDAQVRGWFGVETVVLLLVLAVAGWGVGFSAGGRDDFGKIGCVVVGADAAVAGVVVGGGCPAGAEAAEVARMAWPGNVDFPPLVGL